MPPTVVVPSIPGEMATLLPQAKAIDQPATYPGLPDFNFSATDAIDEPSPVTVIAAPTEHPVRLLSLGPMLSDADLEFSAMAWHEDRLILLPQYPERFGGQAFAIERKEILAHLTGESMDPLVPSVVRVDDGGLSTMVPGFEGYEALAFDGDQAYLTIETQPGNQMLGYLLTGTMSPDGSVLKITSQQRVPLPPQSSIDNMTDETLVIDGDRLLTIYEANGVNVNRLPIVNVHSRELESLAPLSMPNIEYRITDATGVDDAGRFWAINYFFPNDNMLLPDSDPLAEQYGIGATHRTKNHVERLVEFQIDGETVRFTDRPPIQLALSPLVPPQNWEGIVRLQDDALDGFLLVTDRFPTTRLGFVPREVDGTRE